jgi:hypothetical protein
MIPSYASGNLSGSQIVQKDKVSLALLGIFDRPRQGQPTDVQRLFSMFPSGPPGIALLLLRVSVAFPVLLHCYARRDAMAVIVLAVFFLLAIAVIVGFVTPIVAFMAMAVPLGGALGPRRIEYGVCHNIDIERAGAHAARPWRVFLRCDALRPPRSRLAVR